MTFMSLKAKLKVHKNPSNSDSKIMTQCGLLVFFHAGLYTGE